MPSPTFALMPSRRSSLGAFAAIMLSIVAGASADPVEAARSCPPDFTVADGRVGSYVVTDVTATNVGCPASRNAIRRFLHRPSGRTRPVVVKGHRLRCVTTKHTPASANADARSRRRCHGGGVTIRWTDTYGI